MPIIALSGIADYLANFDLQSFLITILVLCVSLSIHEAAHAWAAYKLGDDTAALQGRLTLNPLAHLDPIGALVFIFAHIGWAKPVPINPTRFDRKYSMKKGIAITSLAGPLSNLALAIVSAILYYLAWTVAFAVGVNADNLIFSVLLGLFNMLYSANVGLAVFNLLPVPPLDGYKVFGAALPGRIYYKVMAYERYIGLAFLLLVIFGQGALGTVLGYIRWPFDQVIVQPLDYLFRQIWQALGF